VRKGTVSGVKQGAIGSTRQSSATSGGSAVTTKKSVHAESVTVTGRQKDSATSGKTKSATVTTKKVETPKATTTKKVTKTPKKTTVQTTKRK
jgi:hypothetical protein